MGFPIIQYFSDILYGTASATPTDLGVLSFLKAQGGGLNSPQEVLGLFRQFKSGFRKFQAYTPKLEVIYGPYKKKLGGLHACPLFYGPLKIATFVAQTDVFGQIVIYSKYAFFQASVHNFRTFHHTDPNLVSK